MMQEIEMDNIYEEPQCIREISRDTNRAEKRVCRLFVLSFGILCIIQASLNLSLRLTSHVSDNKTGKLNELQETIKALSRDRDMLQNRISELLNMMRAVEEERDKLKMKLNDFGGMRSPKRVQTRTVGDES
ncbi:uncharacterized protein PAE49_003656 [Odontesthes bonariensis]